MEIGEPVFLARLPKPFSGAGKTRFGPVWGLSDDAKRKRHEVCAATDGDSLNIYSAQSGQIVFSQAIPPQAEFAATPVAVRWVEAKTAFRQTCFAIQDDGLKLHSIVDDGTQRTKPLSRAQVDLKNEASPVTYLDILHSEAGRTIITVQEDGTVSAATFDLQRVAFGTLQLSSAACCSKYLAACSLKLDEALKSVLKGRGDIANGLAQDSIILTTFGVRNSTKSGAGKRPFYAAWSLHPKLTEPWPRNGSVDIQKLFEHDLSGVELAPINNLDHSRAVFGPRASTLDLKTGHGYIRYRLSGAVPLAVPLTDLAGCFDMVPLSSVNLLVVFPKSLSIMDTDYGVAKATRKLIQSSGSRKRKQTGSQVTNGSLELLAYFSHLKRVLARKGTNLVTFDISTGEQSTAKRAKTSSRLADNLGRGQPGPKAGQSLSLEFANALQAETTPERWTEQRLKLDKMLESNQIINFESKILEQLQGKVRGSDVKVSTQAETPDLPPLVCDTIIDYVLTRMFTVASNQGQMGQPPAMTLRLNFTAPQLTKWLSAAGYLSICRLRRALKSIPERYHNEIINPAEITRAIYEADSSPTLLLTHLKHKSNPDVDEIASTVSFLIEKSLEKSKAEAQGRDAIDGQPLQLVAAQGISGKPENLEMDSTVLPPHFLQALEISTNRLGSLSETSISFAVREFFSKKQIFGLVQFLREQLFQGGHSGWLLLSQSMGTEKTLPGPIDYDSTDASTSHLMSLDCIVKILSACLDAIGPLQLLNTVDDDESVENVVPELLSEVTLSAQYIEESAELQGILRETLRYSHSRKSDMKNDDQRSVEARTNPRSGEVTTLYSEQRADEEMSGLSGVLPLSLRDEDVIDPLKVRRGGGQESGRSTREMMMLEGRRKGPYAFERLML